MLLKVVQVGDGAVGQVGGFKDKAFGVTVLGLEPTRFGDKVRSEVAAHFDREKNKVTFSANTPDVPLLPGAQDQLSILLQLAAMLGAEPHRFPQGTTLPV
ncbi:MAG: hypothetical protein WCS42_25465, partial [Verrucomicrobiota bacterium]